MRIRGYLNEHFVLSRIRKVATSHIMQPPWDHDECCRSKDTLVEWKRDKSRMTYRCRSSRPMSTNSISSPCCFISHQASVRNATPDSLPSTSTSSSSSTVPPLPNIRHIHRAGKSHRFILHLQCLPGQTCVLGHPTYMGHPPRRKLDGTVERYSR